MKREDGPDSIRFVWPRVQLGRPIYEHPEPSYSLADSRVYPYPGEEKTMDACSFYENIDSREGGNVSVEVEAGKTFAWLSAGDSADSGAIKLTERELGQLIENLERARDLLRGRES